MMKWSFGTSSLERRQATTARDTIEGRPVPTPEMQKEVCQFMGLINWYRDYIPGVSDTAEPLHGLTKKGVPWDWSVECEASFRKLKGCLIGEQRQLAFPNWNAPFFVETDASCTAVGAVLSQDDEQGKIKVLEFASSSLKEAQRKYSAGELEIYAVIVALRKWKVYLQAAKKVIIITDHHPMKWLRAQRDPRNKYARWILEFEPLNYEIQYRRGQANGAADYLSRTPCEVDSVVDEDEYFVRNIFLIEQEISMVREETKRGQLQDQSIRNAVRQPKEQGKIVSGPFRRQEGMRAEAEGGLFRKRALVIPTS